MSLITDQSTSTATTASLLETILSQEEYDRTDVFPAKDMNLGSHFLCASCTYCRCCPLVCLISFFPIPPQTTTP